MPPHLGVLASGPTHRNARNRLFSYKNMKADGVRKSVFETLTIAPVYTSTICKFSPSYERPPAFTLVHSLQREAMRG